MNIKNIIMIGAGNVATHLSIALSQAGYNIRQVFSRKLPLPNLPPN